MNQFARGAAGRDEVADKIGVEVLAQDPIDAAGLNLLLRSHPRIVDSVCPAVILFADGQVGVESVARLRALRVKNAPIVLLADAIDEFSILALVDCGVVSVIERATTTSAELVKAVLAAAEQSVMPGEQLRNLVTLVRTIQRGVLRPLGLNHMGLDEREVEVLGLLADGATTSEVARALTCSVSTVKHVLRGLSARFDFRNRTHAVAFALRVGVL